MFVHISIHYPLRGKEQFIVDSMHRFGEAVKDKPGFRQVLTTRDKTTGKLVGIALWDSEEQWEAAKPAMRDAIKDDPFHEWEDVPSKVYRLYEQ